MSDIVERLRHLADAFEAGHAQHNVVLHIRAGADEITRLRTENERLRAALRDIHMTTRYDETAAKARAALRAGIAAWPGASGELSDKGNPHLILPLPQEARDA